MERRPDHRSYPGPTSLCPVPRYQALEILHLRQPVAGTDRSACIAVSYGELRVKAVVRDSWLRTPAKAPIMALPHPCLSPEVPSGQACMESSPDWIFSTMAIWFTILTFARCMPLSWPIG